MLSQNGEKSLKMSKCTAGGKTHTLSQRKPIIVGVKMSVVKYGKN